MAVLAVLFTLASIKAGAARIISACLGKHLGEDASYDSEPRAFVLTTVEPDGSPTWTGKACGNRDTVVRVYATAVTENTFKVTIGAKLRGGRADRALAVVECASVESAELVLTSTVYALSQGIYNANTLTSALPRAFHGFKLCERPDQQRSAGRAVATVTKVTDAATDAMRAMLAAAEAADSKPADKPATQATQAKPQGK
jgi:hypothetical protein